MSAERSGRVGIGEVARHAGVSTATVSLIMNGKGRIAPATRKNVLDIARRLGYTPSAAAVALATGQSRTIAVALSRAYQVPNVVEIDYFDRTIAAATKQALERDYAMVINPPGLNLTLLARIPLDGLIVVDPIVADPMVAGHPGHPPLVTVGRAEDGNNVAGMVDNDHVSSTGAVLDHLRAAGGAHPALLAADLHDSFTLDCVAAHRLWSEQQGLAPLSEVVNPRDEAAVAAAIDRIARADVARPLAIYANDDLLGARVVQWARRHALAIGDDVLLVTCTDRTDFGSVGEELTTLELNPENLSAAAVDLLIDVVEGKAVPGAQRILPTRLRLRSSTSAGPAPRTPS